MNLLPPSGMSRMESIKCQASAERNLLFTELAHEDLALQIKAPPGNAFFPNLVTPLPQVAGERKAMTDTASWSSAAGQFGWGSC